MEMEKSTKDLEGLGGWLILVGIGVVIGPFRMLYDLRDYWDIFSPDVWPVLTDPASAAYHALIAPYFIILTLANIVMLLGSFYLIVLFFWKKVHFPKLYIWLILFSTLGIVIDAAGFKIIWPNEPYLDSETSKAIFQTMISLCIWIPYMRVSKRVQATFVR